MSEFAVGGFPEGTTVGAYRTHKAAPGLADPPRGTALEEAVVTGGRATFSSLIDGTYYAYALIGTEHRYIRFHVTPPYETYKKGSVIHGANAAATRPEGYASVEWIGSVEPANALSGDTWIDTT